MTTNDVKVCMADLSNKKCEGYDQIPVCMLFDARNILLHPMVSLFNSLHSTKKIPEQWKVAKIIPIFKKGSKTINMWEE